MLLVFSIFLPGMYGVKKLKKNIFAPWVTWIPVETAVDTSDAIVSTVFGVTVSDAIV